MLIKIFLALSSISPYLKKLLWKQWYQFLASHYQTKEWSFMNYGYTAIDDHSETLKLDEADEPDRYAIQLYHHVTWCGRFNESRRIGNRQRARRGRIVCCTILETENVDRHGFFRQSHSVL